jgi:RNA polymerase sigma-70 factor (ECF subfamily)
VAQPAFSDGRAGASEVHRSRLFGVACRMLASRAEAEDVVQEGYLRWHRADRTAIRDPQAWLVTTTTRLAIDRLRALEAQREAYTGPWRPEPLLGREPPPRPDRSAELSSDLSVAFVVLLERLAPEERAAFLLHDVFDCDHAEIARTLGRSEAGCRQRVHRARERILTVYNALNPDKLAWPGPERPAGGSGARGPTGGEP